MKKKIYISLLLIVFILGLIIYYVNTIDNNTNTVITNNEGVQKGDKIEYNIIDDVLKNDIGSVEKVEVKSLDNRDDIINLR